MRTDQLPGRFPRRPRPGPWRGHRRGGHLPGDGSDERPPLPGVVAEGTRHPHVDIRFDEAVAAAMFHVLCESGGLVGTSVEAFIARCHPVGAAPDERPTRWAHTVLIVDVGGGTTDVALLDLDLRDETDRTVEGGGSPHYGHYFRLRPVLLGTTGESQRGGDWVTLQVFRWLKVLLADHLLVHEPDVVRGVVDRLDQRYRGEDGAYLPGSLSRTPRSPRSSLARGERGRPRGAHGVARRGRRERRRRGRARGAVPRPVEPGGGGQEASRHGRHGGSRRSRDRRRGHRADAAAPGARAARAGRRRRPDTASRCAAPPSSGWSATSWSWS